MKLPLFVALIPFILLSCKKDADPEISPIDPVTATTYLPVLRLISASSYFGDAGGTFKYDSIGRITEAKCYLEEPVRIYYNKDTISHMTFFYDNANGLYRKRSAIFVFAANKQLERVVYKPRIESYDINDPKFRPSNPYFSSTSDGVFEGVDSLFYSPIGRLIEIRCWSHYSLQRTVKYIYENDSRPSPSKVTFLSGLRLDEYKLTTTDMENPVGRAVWIMPYISNMTIMDTGFTLSVPIAGNRYSFYDTYFAAVKNCISKYIYTDTDVNGNPTNHSYSSANFSYSYNADSTRFQSKMGYEPGVTYVFRKQ
ncbi:hypothetical protein [Paraflavitalea pollutisoli]|uniref:hypothetical protein n=1 Tax=Paraflavitalea pollutisoli TaxID=3034143 RepID=UPI0023EDE60A|nr:hypothetical protein [Paraflavitalea sp. H1-2-19X]